jgi:hypothetical protein
MIKQHKIFSLSYSENVGSLCLLEDAVDKEEMNEIQIEKNFIHRLYIDALEGLDSIPVPKMYLCNGSFTDFVWAENGLLMFNQRVVDAFSGELEKYGELHPVECEEGSYYFYRVTHVIEAMNLSAISRVDSRYKAGIQYNSISSSKYEFISENVATALIFKDIYATPPRRVFLGERFVEILKHFRFSGIGAKTFKPIWPRTELDTSPTDSRLDLTDLNL